MRKIMQRDLEARTNKGAIIDQATQPHDGEVITELPVYYVGHNGEVRILCWNG